MKQQLQKLALPLRRLTNNLIRYRLIIGLLLVILPVAFLNFRISHYTDTQSDQQRLDDALAKVKQIRFDQEAVDKIKSLQDQGTTVDPDIDRERTNPF
jgi:hypothetical protein